MKALEIQLYPYKEHPEILRDLFGNRLRVSLDSLYPVFDYISDPVMEIGFLKEKYCIIEKGNLFGVIKEDGRIFIPPMYVQVIPTEDERFLLLSTNFKWGLKGIVPESMSHVLFYSIDIPCEYDEIKEFSEGFYVVRLEGKYGFAPLIKDNLIISPEYEEVKPFHEGIAAVKRDGKWGFIDKTLTLVAPFVYDKVSNFEGGIAEVWRDGGKLKIDFEGNDISKVQSLNGYDYKYHGTCHEGLYAVTRDNKLGFTNIHGNITIPIEYNQPRELYRTFVVPSTEVIPSFSEGFACVQKGDYWGYIDKRNRVVFPFILDSYEPITNGYAIVSDGIPFSRIVTIAHFNKFLRNERIPFHVNRPPFKPKDDDFCSGWTRKELEDAYMAVLEDDIRNEWNFD